MPTNGPQTRTRPHYGLAFWMDRALEECERASAGFAPEPVHDLRVALRRCRTMADGLMAVDPDSEWEKMKKAGKRLFSRLGELRDAQVMQEWVHHFDSPGDPVTSRLLEILAFRENQWKEEAARALQDFDRKQWRKWSALLPRRASRIRPGSAIFKHLALERWTAAYELHRRAIRNRSQAALHQLRIGLKRLRYMVENFLPQQHEAWGGHLKTLQDWLGEIHDLDVLWATAQQARVFLDTASRDRWGAKIREERALRVEKYRAKMMGPTALWHVWRAELPAGAQIESVALRRLKLWASFLDPDFQHSQHVARLAGQLFDGLASQGYGPKGATPDQRETLRLAALLHDIGRSRGEKGYQKASRRLIGRLSPPLGLNGERLQMAAIVARYHRGALPQARQAAFATVPSTRRQDVLWLAAILRLANAFDADRAGRVLRLQVAGRGSSNSNGFITVLAEGYSARDRLAEGIAAARHLLEIACRRPVMIKALPRKAPNPTPGNLRKLRGNAPAASMERAVTG